MAPYTYYYVFSVIFVALSLWAIFNLMYVRIKGRTLIGNSYKPGTYGYRRLKQISGNLYIEVAVIIFVLSVINLINALKQFMDNGHPHTDTLLWGVPLFVIIISYVSFKEVRKQYGDGKLEEVVRRKKRG